MKYNFNKIYKFFTLKEKNPIIKFLISKPSFKKYILKKDSNLNKRRKKETNKRFPKSKYDNDGNFIGGTIKEINYDNSMSIII